MIILWLPLAALCCVLELLTGIGALFAMSGSALIVAWIVDRWGPLALWLQLLSFGGLGCVLTGLSAYVLTQRKSPSNSLNDPTQRLIGNKTILTEGYRKDSPSFPAISIHGIRWSVTATEDLPENTEIVVIQLTAENRLLVERAH